MHTLCQEIHNMAYPSLPSPSIFSKLGIKVGLISLNDKDLPPFMLPCREVISKILTSKTTSHLHIHVDNNSTSFCCLPLAFLLHDTRYGGLSMCMGYVIIVQ